ncbi:MAG: hypothetical protein ACLTT2_05570 [Alphaproteobacteria bacterium]
MELIKIEDDWRCDFEDTFDHEPLIVLYKRIEYKYNKHALLDNILAIEFRMRRLRDIDDIFKSQLIKWVENSIPRTFKKMLVFSIFYILNLECAILQGNATVKIFLTNGNFISADYSYKPAKDQPNFIEFVAKDQKNSIEIFFTFLHNEITKIEILPIKEDTFKPLSFDISSVPEHLEPLVHLCAQKIGYKINTKKKVYSII